MPRQVTALLTVLALTCGSCGSESTDSTQQGFAPWAEQGLIERNEYMLEVVEPAMREIFQRHDPETYADFGCETCHGPGAASARYAMPAHVTALPRDGTLTYAQELNPEEYDFMLDEVFPAFVELVGEEKFSEQTGQGFRCIRCHLELE